MADEVEARRALGHTAEGVAAAAEGAAAALAAARPDAAQVPGPGSLDTLDTGAGRLDSLEQAQNVVALHASRVESSGEVPECSGRVHVEPMCFHSLQSLIPHLFSLFCLISPSTRSVSFKSFPFGFSICIWIGGAVSV